ncbi:MAG: FAD:protein FMN transferase [[Bacteroides] pectinophilus]|nr:FAD:protein FMN transferase [[Bacteroides] pectinophilus]
MFKFKKRLRKTGTPEAASMPVAHTLFMAAALTAMAAGAGLAGCGGTGIGTAGSNGSSYTAAEESRYTTEVFAMDTYMTLTAYGDNAQTAVNEAVAEIRRLDDRFSVGNAESDVTLINNAGGGHVSEETAFLIEKSLDIGRKTNGAFDITVYPLMELWGFTSGNYRVPSDEEIKDVLSKVSYTNVIADGQEVTLNNNAMIDFGGIAKGYTSSRVMEIFRQNGVEHGIISLGGNVQALNSKPDNSSWRVAVQKPDGDGSYLGILSVDNKAVITSGGYERYFKQNGMTYHHIINPSTGYPSDSDLTSVTIVCEDGTTADALSTSLFVMGLADAMDFYRNSGIAFDMILYDRDGKLYVTQDIADSFSSDIDVEIISRTP